MAGLVLSLKPNEKFLVNGALLENGPKRSQIRIEAEGVNVFRMSDVIHPDEVNTPIKRVYYAAQLVLSGDNSIENMEPQVKSGLASLVSVFAGTEMIKNILKAVSAVEHGRYYSVLCALKPLLNIEQELLDHSQIVSTNDISEPLLVAAG